MKGETIGRYRRCKKVVKVFTKNLISSKSVVGATIIDLKNSKSKLNY